MPTERVSRNGTVCTIQDTNKKVAVCFQFYIVYYEAHAHYSLIEKWTLCLKQFDHAGTDTNNFVQRQTAIIPLLYSDVSLLKTNPKYRLWDGLLETCLKRTCSVTENTEKALQTKYLQNTMGLIGTKEA